MSIVSFNTYWRGGRGASQHARKLSSAFQAAAHTLVYAVDHGAGGAEAPGYIYSHLAELYSGTSYLAEALDRMGARLVDLVKLGVVTHDTPGGDVHRDAAETERALQVAATTARLLTVQLQQAQNAIAHLGLTDKAAEAVYRAFGDGQDDE